MSLLNIRDKIKTPKDKLKHAVHRMLTTKKYHQSKNAYQGFATVTFTPETESVTSVPKIEIELSGGAIVRIF